MVQTQNVLQLLNQSLWVSGSRIAAAYRFRGYGLRRAAAGVGPAIPVDVAGVHDELLERSRVFLASTVATLRPYDAAWTEAARREMEIPEGATVLSPLYRQYLELEAAPQLAETPQFVWSDMPEQMYLANRLGSVSDQDLEVLADLGYIRMVEEKGLVSDQEMGARIERAILARQTLASAGLLQPRGDFSKLSSKVLAQRPKVVEGLIVPTKDGGTTVIVLVSITALLLAVGAVAVFVVPKLIEQATVDATLRANATHNERVVDWNRAVVEGARPMLDYCVQWAQSRGEPPDRCNEYLRGLPFEGLEKPGDALNQLAGLTRCGFEKCAAFFAGGAAVGAAAGWFASRRLGRRV